MQNMQTTSTADDGLEFVRRILAKTKQQITKKKEDICKDITRNKPESCPSAEDPTTWLLIHYQALITSKRK